MKKKVQYILLLISFYLGGVGGTSLKKSEISA
jgi:hypothetical protein